jgi:hypothetical protein
MIGRAINFALVGLFAASVAMAGHVYGTIRHNNQPYRNAEVSISCGAETVPGRTNQEGVYRMFVRSTGSCQLVLEPNSRRAPGSLYSYDRPTAYDFDLVQQNGRWVLLQRR